MSEPALRALEALTLNWTRDLKDVWAPCDYHIGDLHPEATRLIRQGIGEAAMSSSQNPLGVAIQGEGGVGKTHLLGWTREQAELVGGYFFLVGDLSRTGFWAEILRTIVEQLQPLQDGSRHQLDTLLSDLAEKAGLDLAARAGVTGRRAPSPDDVTAFIKALRQLAPLALTYQDTARALVLLGSPEYDHLNVGYGYFADGLDPADRRFWGFRSGPKDPQQLIRELSGLLALSGPTVLAVDQIDALIDEVNRAGDSDTAQRDAIREVTSGLMGLRDLTHRTLTVISCLPDTWEYVRKNAVKTAVDRFSLVQLRNIPSADIGRLMIEKRFAPAFASVHFEPRYPSWPIRPDAFADATGYTARTLLQRVNSHLSACLNDKAVRELDRLDGAPADGLSQGAAVTDRGELPVKEEVTEEELAALDRRFHQLRESADISPAFDKETEDDVMSALLDAGLGAWIREHGEPLASSFAVERLSRRNPPLHASLQMVTDQRLERTCRWAFRAIAASHHKTVLAQVGKAIAAAKLGAEGTERQLFLLRNSPWPNGQVTKDRIAEFKALGGIDRTVTGEDLKTFAALKDMLANPNRELRAWLTVRQPAHHTELLTQTLRDADSLRPAGPPGPAAGQEITASEPPPEPEASRAAAEQAEAPPTAAPTVNHQPAAGPVNLQGGRPTIYVGAAMPAQAPVSLELELLRRHVSVFAGAGSGKTVLLRRLIESCALRGVSSIVLDLNNDLARLGDAWPLPPLYWADGDADLAAEYLANTEVVVWTPGRVRGRPVSFQPLPAFGDVLNDEDEFTAAVSVAVGALAPRVYADKGTIKAEGEKAVLREALSYFGRSGGGGLDEFISLLTDLPDEASSVPQAVAAAKDLAKQLHVARINDPLFAGSGEPVDPGVLLTPSPGKRARVSVISLIGLSEPQQQQSFVNQLQMALFSWIKKHPAADGQLGGLLVMDEAQELAPSGKSTLCRESTLRLVAQGRKYGLGMVFATQQPKGLHNWISNNSRTQFYGSLGSPAQIEAARDLAKAKGGDLPDIGRLKTGQFYFATEGTAFRKVRTPVSLSYHPSSPLTEEEVIRRARA